MSRDVDTVIKTTSVVFTAEWNTTGPLFSLIYSYIPEFHWVFCMMSCYQIISYLELDI